MTTPAPAGPLEPEPLLHRLGGPGAVAVIVADLYDRVLGDPVLSRHLEGVDDEAFDRAAGHLLDALAAHCPDPALVDDVIQRVAALRPRIVGSRRA